MDKLIKKGILCSPIALVMVGCNQSEKEIKQPNVIVILADDLGYGDTGAYGATTVKTPNIDRLANNGVRFTDGHATSATSTPSRYALFTGMYPWKNPRAHILDGDAPLIIDPAQYTMPNMFRSKGYTTAAIGKWHLGMGNGNVNWNEIVTPGAKEVGFDYSCLIAATNDRVPTVFVENGGVVGLEADDPIEVNYKKNFEGEPTALTNPELMTTVEWSQGHNCSVINGIPRIGYMKGGKKARWVDEDMADYFVGKVKTFIDDNSDKPFFLYYGLHQPHVPRSPHSRFVGSTTMGPRGDAIAEADWCIGELIDKLESKGLLENTLIIFSSDNGPVLDDGYKDGAAELIGSHKPLGELRGGKYSLFDGGTRVPFFTYWKGEIKPMVSNALVSQLDIMASLAKLIDVKLPDGLDSREHLDAFMGTSETARDGYVVEATGRLAYRKGNYALIPPYGGAKRNSTNNEVGALEEYTLYDLSSNKSQKDSEIITDTKLIDQIKNEFIAATEGYYKLKKR